MSNYTPLPLPGSGTEPDPYIVKTIAELFDGASREGAYVRVEGNSEGVIDVARDQSTTNNDGTQWRMGTARTLNICCEQLYSDDVGRVTIRGLISTAPQFIKCTRQAEGGDPDLTTCILKNLQFADCVFLRPDNADDADIDLTSADGVSMLLQNTSFSVQMRNGDPIAARRDYVRGGLIYDSAFYALGTPLAEGSEQSRVAGGSLFLPDYAARCNVQAEGWLFTAGNRPLVANVSRSLILADVTICGGGELLRNCSSSLYAITPTPAEEDRRPPLDAVNCSGVNVIDTTVWGAALQLRAPDFHWLTTADCKKADVLRSIGFLP